MNSGDKDNKKRGRLPVWLKRPMPASDSYANTSAMVSDLGIETICTNANCPNRGECWDAGTATVLILGNICTRNCKFCSVAHGKPLPPDATESGRVAELAKRLKIKYLVITSVDRDDLDDGGASQFRDVIVRCRAENPETEFELLVPDFRDCQEEALEILEEAVPFVFGHNVETVPALYSKARPGGNYQLSLDLLKKAKARFPQMATKSSIMLGLGETDEQIIEVLNDLRDAGCDRVAIGQYLRPTKDSLEVVEYITPDKFAFWGETARGIGFSWVMSSPFTRSSYHAEKKQ
ncbi:MAG TPA: lipoyl synthase [Phycisphaerales bacterium]|nr:lipoyl synthase [Phycisphaerales bacterium]